MKIIKKNIGSLRQKALNFAKNPPFNSASINSFEAEALKTVQLLEEHQIKLATQSEELLQAKLAVQDAIDLYDLASIGHFTLSKLGEIVNLNLCGADMLCKERSLATNKLFGDFVSDDTKSDFYLFLDKVFSSKNQESCNVTITSKRMAEKYVHLTGIVTKDGKQSLITAIDFNNFKLEHNKLQQSEAKYRGIFENVQDVYYEATLEGVLLDVSPSIELLSRGQFTREELIGKSFAGLYAEPEARNIFFAEIFKSGRVIDHELLFNNKDGSIVPVAVSSTILRDTEGVPIKITGIIRDITSRKLTENALQQSNEKMEAIIAASPYGIGMVSLDGKLKLISDKLASIYGYSIDERNDFIGESVFQFIDVSDHAKILENINKLIASDFSQQISEYQSIKKDNSRFYIELNSTLIYNNSQPESILFVMQDITERKLAQIAFLESELKFRTLANSGQALIWTSDLDMSCNYFNQVWLDFTGRTLDKELGNGWTEGVHQEDIDKCLETYTTAFKKQESFSMIYRLRRHDGEFRWLLDDGKPRYDIKGEFIGYIGHCLDITERQLSEEAILKSEEKYRFMFANNPQPMWIVDFETHAFVEVNHSAINHYGYSKEEFLSMTIKDLQAKDKIQDLLIDAELAKTTLNNNAQALEWEQIKKNGEKIHVEIIAHLMSFNESKAYHILINDITERKNAERLRDQQLLYTKALNEIAEIIISQENTDEILENVNNVLGKTLQVDRTLIYKIMFDKQEIVGLCEWLRLNHPDITVTKGTYPLEMFKDSFSEIWNSKQVLTSQFDAVNEHFIKDSSGVVLHQQMNIKSLIWYPFRFQENGFHVFTLNQILEHRQWTAEDINFLESVGKQVNLALEKISLLEERRIVENELAISEKRFSQLVEQSQEVVWEVDTEGLYTYVSPMSVQIYGYTPEQMIGKLHFFDLWPATQREQIKVAIFEVFDRKEIVQNFINTIIKPDGIECILSTNGIPMISELGDLMGYRGLNANITERVQAENERKKVEEELRKLSQAVEQSPIMTYITDLSGDIEYVNPKVAEITGYTNEYLIGKNPRIFSSGEKSNIDYQNLWKTISSGKEWRGEFHNKKKNGDLFWASALISPIFDSNGEMKHYLSVEEDITERKLNEKQIIELNETLELKVKERTIQLAETNTNLTNEIVERKRIQDALSVSEKSYRTVVENVNEVIFQTDTEGLWVFLNKSWEVVTGFSLDESLGQLNVNYIHPDDRQRNMEHFEPLILRQKEYSRYTVRYLTKDGGFRWIEVFARLGVNENDEITGTYGTLQDITERRQAEDLLLWNKSLLELMSNSSPLGFLVVDNRTDDILYFNQQFCKIWNIEQLMEQMHNGELKNNDIIPYCLPVLVDIPTFAASCTPLQDEENRTIVSDEIPFTENRTIHRYSTQIRGNNDEYYGRFYIFEDITERKRAEEFEDELLQLSIQMNGISDSEISNAINKALTKIGSFLDADRAYIFELNDDETMDNTYEWCKEGILPEIVNLHDIPTEIFPMWMKTLKQNRNVIIHDVKKLPTSWNAEREMLESQGIQSTIAIPILSDNTLIGFVGLDTVANKKEYNESEINNLRVWSNMLAGILNKQRNDLILNQTRQNYETFFNTIDDFLFVLNENGNILHTNKLVTDRLEYTTEELISHSVLMVHPVERREEAGRIVGEMLAGTADFCPVPLLTKTGNYIPVETRVKPGFWDGKPVIFGVSKDMSKIQLSEEKFSKAFHTSSALMAISGFEDEVFIDVNDTFIKKTGYSKEELIGKSSIDLNLFEDLRIRERILDNLINNIQVREIEFNFKPKFGEPLTGLFSTERIYVGDKLCLLTLIIDITERKKAEEETRKAKQDAEKANMAKSEFLSRMSHELRTPLNSILGFAQLLGMGELNPKQERGVNHILNSGKHLLTLIDEVLDISRIEAGRLSLTTETIQLQSIIEEIMDSIKPLVLEKNITMVLENSPSNQLFVLSDKKALKQVLINLLNNAVKYNREGGFITVSTSVTRKNDAGVIFARVSISDTGLGIESESISKLFTPFERIGAEITQTEGTGLGLAVVKKLMTAMDGQVGVDSTVGIGSTFWIDLPVNDNQKRRQTKKEENKDLTEAIISTEKEVVIQNNDKAKHASERDTANEDLSVHKAEKVNGAAELNDSINEIAPLISDNKDNKKLKTILYIEDNAANVELVEQILKSQRREIQLISNENGKLATSLALEHTPDLILLDLNLPDIHGSEVLQLLQENAETKDIPVIVISSDVMPHRVEQLLSSSAKKYLTKPLEVLNFLSVINEFIKD